MRLRVVSFVVTTLLVIGCAPASAPVPSVIAAAPVTIAGSGELNTKPFALAGTYTVTWTAANATGCFHGASLMRVDGTFVNESLPDADVGTQPASGTTMLYNLDPADYYLRVHSGCDWSYTFTP